MDKSVDSDVRQAWVVITSGTVLNIKCFSDFVFLPLKENNISTFVIYFYFDDYIR